ncbi:hypothetical protein EYS09_07940 [Streptomyces kasugaensis]|uniref:Uncharacterized protein n=1 Tax=Streptomyces kasugaensis TaxID=1946 RepID=A0A4Q9I0T7_STRKA|nr:hypothetical protein [Streptomyces kasugaensis]TBO60220.1 hypothetical protein EYS09_07940 [Streptomyces kasugaensis]
MPLGYSFQITPEELQEIFARLQPYLPKHLKKVDAQPYGLRFEFAPFTGREEEPSKPSTHGDPKLDYVRESEDETEHLLREKASVVLSNLYETAREEWKDAAYVADLKAVVKDAPDRWKTYQHEIKALSTAYDYLRTPEAAKEWPSAVSRLIDAQDRTKAAATAFDERAREIAEVHDTHLYADLGHDAALKAAGYPGAKDWHITGAGEYGKHYYSDWDNNPPLEEQARRLIEQQDTHVAKIGRLSGATAGN